MPGIKKVPSLRDIVRREARKVVKGTAATNSQVRQYPMGSGVSVTPKYANTNGDPVILSHIEDVDNPHQTTYQQTGIPLCKFDADVDPAVTDDETVGYGYGSFWWNKALGKMFLLQDASTGAAAWVWINQASGAGDMLKSVYDDDDDGIVNEADYAAEADHATSADSATSSGNADTLDGYHASEFALAGSAITGVPAYQAQTVIGTNYTTMAGFNGAALIRDQGDLWGARGSLNFYEDTKGHARSYLFSMVVNSDAARAVSLISLQHDDSVYVYLNGSLIQSWVGENYGTELTTLNLVEGENVVQFLFNNVGGGSNGFHLAAWFVSGVTWVRAATS